MRSRTGSKKARDFLYVFGYAFLTTFAGVIGGLNKATVETERKRAAWWGDFVQWSQNNTYWIVPGAAVACALLTPKLKNSERAKFDAAIKKILNTFRKEAFPKEQDFLAYRVTLFVHKKMVWKLGLLPKVFNLRTQPKRFPWSGWLVPYERAGNYGLNSRACFYAPLADVDKAEGVAGHVLKTRMTQRIENLRDLNTRAPTPKQIQEYATATKASLSFVEEKLAQQRPLPQSIWGAPIEVDSEVHGVVIVDCRVPTLPENLDEAFFPVGLCLSSLLNRK